ncbi:hypothetical protein TH53_21490 [Pedobacter lusitanus]|uniref:Uncharacterized protein n=1 Tax=Pedobacter lusitanus TaxID=1503925 RepID=A0A0D0GD82_9SPHI|nr:hypothetical protein [Pedobacter lusitanus]KIO75277.1 hypothetical protein TH53_21490 [Pedobacter lusitanus]
MRSRFFYFFVPVLSVSILISSCKKDKDLDDSAVYLWKRELFSADIANSSSFSINPFKTTTDPFNYTNTAYRTAAFDYNPKFLIKTDYVSLTNAQVKME